MCALYTPDGLRVWRARNPRARIIVLGKMCPVRASVRAGAVILSHTKYVIIGVGERATKVLGCARARRRRRRRRWRRVCLPACQHASVQLLGFRSLCVCVFMCVYTATRSRRGVLCAVRILSVSRFLQLHGGRCDSVLCRR